ncbi:hypothetical protein BJI67_04585 [Acidihalobacter aeolianus]|uniref:histidine kinase n=2 Tax=Acidihalobacter aeolianus TaxID=2792603 RepID=A0A1D8KBT5_9GAMM|nr:hypothetical protein BJI67_04585 [Acidihalobacter aeolianus]
MPVRSVPVDAVASRFIVRFALGWALATVLLVGLGWQLYRFQAAATLTGLRTTERHTLQLANESIDGELRMLRGDTLYLSDLSSLKTWLVTGTSAARSRFEHDLLAFAIRRGLYDQLRFIAVDGYEKVRINWDNGHPIVVAENALQDKAGRYYVRDTLALARGEVYVSPFDLNIEHGHIQQPLKPMIRLGTPVFDAQGKLRGMVMLNYLGQRLLKMLKRIAGHGSHGLWLLNGKGYWLMGPDQRLDWGFMYPQRTGTRFQSKYPLAWAEIQRHSGSGQFMRHGRMFTYASVPLEHAFGGSVGGRHWVLVSSVPRHVLAAIVAQAARGLDTVFSAGAVLWVLLGLVLGYYSYRRRASEITLRASEARFRGLLESAPDAFVIVDAQGCIAMVNSQALSWFGYAREELIGQPIEILVPERYRDGHPAHRNQYLKSPVLRPIGEGKELFARRKDGSEFPVEISLGLIGSTSDQLVIGIVRDVSVRKHAEEARRAAQQRYRELVDNLPIGVYRKTPGKQGHFGEVNPTMVDMLEAGSAEALGAIHVVDMYVDPADEVRFHEDVERQGAVRGREVRLKTLKGRVFHAAISAAMRRAPDGQTIFDGTVEDISERKESEEHIAQLNATLSQRAAELEAINRELEAFSYSVSHDLRAPLRAIDGFSRILLDDYGERLDEKGQDRLKRIRAASQRMAQLIDDLLKLSRVTRTELQHETVDLTALAEEVVGELCRSEPEREVSCTLAPGMNAEGDSRLLRVLLENLLGNAWKYTGKSPAASVEMGMSEEHGVRTYFIRDNGAGFDMAYADKLFGAFQRLHDARDFPGTGIGLATVQRIVHKHGGRVWAESEVDRGATFYFTLQHSEAI